jgi:prophage regulatory protein
MAQLPDTGFLRLKQIIGDKKTNIPALIPISRSAWWLGVRTGVYPKGVKLGPRTTAWRVEAIRALIATTSAAVR